LNIFKASIINFKTVNCVVDNISDFNSTQFYLKNGNKYININFHYNNNNIITLLLSEEINIKYKSTLYYNDNIFTNCDYFKLFSSEEFNGRFFTLDTLGLDYNESYSDFRLWSPAAISVSLLLYKDGDASDLSSIRTRIKMTETAHGIWFARVNKDLKGSFYTYEVDVYNNVNEVVDPYAKAVGINGQRGAIIDLKDTNPASFSKDVSPKYENYTDAIIYELNVRDISINPNSFINNKGKFLGLTEENTHTRNMRPTGLAYLKNLGITHVQIMPMFDFSFKSTDEKNPIKYNWGYDPQNYNTPEGSYSTNPYSPCCRIKELKEMIYSFHKNGICVNMDVVYNHVFNVTESNFELIFPGYYFRYNDDGSLSNGTSCGNDTASENLMMKRFIIDSVLYWHEEYHIDGFRFDLMGIHDIDTIDTIKHKLPKNIMVYGEGWDLGTNLPKEKKAIIANSLDMPDIGFFNDITRDLLKGSVFSRYDEGFINGKEGLENGVMLSVTGCIKYSDFISGPFSSPTQSINYITCHDNNTLWDKLNFTNSLESEIEKINRVKFAIGILFTSQGVPMLSSGLEFLVTKNGLDNSFDSPDSLNSIDWDRKDKYEEVVNYTQSFINLRKNHPSFRLSSLNEIKDSIEFLFIPSKNTVAFVIRNKVNEDSFKNIVVIYNANKYSEQIKLPSGNWNLIGNKYGISDNPISTHNGLFFAEGISVSVLYNNF
jgi:pullulanase